MANGEVVGPDANGNYQLIVDGRVVQSWNWRDTMGATGGAGGTLQTGRTSSFDAAGKPLPMVQGTPVAAETIAPQTLAPDFVPTAPSDWYADPTQAQRGGDSRSTATPRGGGGYAPTANEAQGAIGGDWFADPGAGFGAPTNPFANVPAYQNGMRHPAAGGAPLRPGGMFASQDEGGGGQQITQYDTGASAGPLGVQSPRSDLPSLLSRRAFDENGRKYAERGTHTSPLYDAMRAKGDAVAAKVRGMADKLGMRRFGGTSSSGGGSYGGYASGGSTADYRRTGRRVDKAYDKYNEALEEGVDVPVRGWSKQQGYKPGTIDAVLGDPTLLLGDAVPGYRSTGSFGSQAIESLPMTDMALMMFGTQNKKGLTAKTPQVPIPGILKKQADLKQPKLEKDEKRVLDSSAVANKVAGMWKSLNDPTTSYGDLDFMDREKMLGNLASSDKRSILRQNITTQFDEDPNAAMASISSYLRSAMSVGQPSLARNALVADVDRRITNSGGDLLRMKPDQASRFVKQLAQGYLNG